MAFYFALLQRFYDSIGFSSEDTRFRELPPKDRAFYTTRAFDFEINSGLGWVEVVACNYRTDYDLSGHSRASKKDLTVMEGDAKVLPHVIELSLGVDRTLFLLLDKFFVHEQNRDVLRVSPRVSPYLAAVLPLISKPPFEDAARAIFDRLKLEDFAVFYDESGAIGRRYRRMDEIGTPYCVTVDPQTLEDHTVTLRQRDSMEQRRLKSDELVDVLHRLRDQMEPGTSTT